MVDNVRTQQITRDQIAAIVGENPRAIRLFEAVLSDVSVTLPDAIDQAELMALAAHAEDGAKTAAQQAMQTAMEVQSVTLACQRISSELQAMRNEFDLLRLELEDTRCHLSSAISQLQAATGDALTLTLGA